MPRHHALADPEFAQAVAEAFAAGLSRQDMADMFNVSDLMTISRWRRDPRVKSRALKIIEDRVLQVTRKVDSVLANKLEAADGMTVNELLAIRKEYLGGALRSQTEKADEETINEAQSFLENDPAAAAALEKMLRTRKVPGALE